MEDTPSDNKAPRQAEAGSGRPELLRLGQEERKDALAALRAEARMKQLARMEAEARLSRQNPDPQPGPHSSHPPGKQPGWDPQQTPRAAPGAEAARDTEPALTTVAPIKAVPNAPKPVPEADPDRVPARKPAEKPSRVPAQPISAPAHGLEPAPVGRAVPQAVLPVAGPARMRKRHYGLVFAFVLMVILPTLGTGWYLWTRAVDQFASTVGFSVRKEEAPSALDVLGALKVSASGSNDTDILYEFIQSQELVRTIDAKLNLRTLFSVPHETDPVFSFDPSGSIEDLVSYWQRMVRIYYDNNTGLMELRITAFRPEDAQAIATATFDESSKMINDLSAIARADATRYAEEELERSIERLKQARQAMTAFRLRTQIVDPTADVQGQLGLLTTLQGQLAEALIESDLLRQVTGSADTRIEQAELRIKVIEERIAEERRKFGVGGQGPGGEDYATIFAEFERLSVDRVFAENAYTASLSAYDAALAEAQRQSRYLAAYIRPTLAERAEYPQRAMLLGLTALFLLLIWSIITLIYYSIRDRR